MNKNHKHDTWINHLISKDLHLIYTDESSFVYRWCGRSHIHVSQAWFRVDDHLIARDVFGDIIAELRRGKSDKNKYTSYYFFEMIVCWFSYMTTKTKIPKMIFSCLTPRVKVCIHLENFIFVSKCKDFSNQHKPAD